ncbi:MAG: type II toxin-antitoxin system VapC family toxin [Promethearchaeota archaeon]
MRIIIDTSVLVYIDRKNKKIIEIMKELHTHHELYISTITISEILTGSNLRQDAKKSVNNAKKLLNQMKWIDLNPQIAEKIGELNAYLISQGKKIELPDVIISATCLVNNLDVILTFNNKHFSYIPSLRFKTMTPFQFKILMNNSNSENFNGVAEKFLKFIYENELEVEEYENFFKKYS